MKKSRGGLVFFFIALMAILSIAGCASLATVFSKGGGTLGEARRDLAEGRGLEAMIRGVDAVKLDPKLVQAQEFLKDNVDNQQSQALVDLATSDKSADPQTIANRVRVWTLLVRLNDGLRTLALPFKDPAGKWEWTITIKDYSEQLKAEKTKAYNAFFALGLRETGLGKVAAAKSAFESAINDYADDTSTERFQARATAAAACVAYAQPYAVSYDTAELKNAIEAFKLAAYFEPVNVKARDGIKAFSLRLADIFVSEGMAEEYRDDTDSLKKAVKFYEEALVWNPTQGDALWLLPRIRERLAERFYRQGRNLEEGTGRSDPDGAIGAYLEARKWVPEYLDTTKRIYMIRTRSELADMNPAITGAGGDMARLYGRITSISYKVDIVLAGVDKTQAVVTKTAGLDLSIEGLMKDLSGLTEGTSLARQTANLSAGFTPLRESLVRIAAAAGSEEKPSIQPLKSALTDLKTVTDRTKGTIEGSKASLGKLMVAFGKMANCVSGLKSEQNFKDAVEELKNISHAASSWQKGLRSLNLAFDHAESTADELSQTSQIPGAADILASGIEQIIKGLQLTAQDLDSAFGKRVTVDNNGKPYSLTVREILTALPAEARPFEKQFFEAADSALGSIRARLSIQLPRATPFVAFAEDLERFASRTASAASSAKAAGDASLIAAQSDQRVAEELKKLSDLTGCAFSQ